MKHKSIEFTPEAVKQDGFFYGYGSVFGVKDSYGDVVEKGAFKNSIVMWQGKGKMPKLLWQHDSTQPIGVWTKMEEDDHGLRLEGQLLINDIPKAKEAHALLKAGALDGLSIGYRVKDEKYDRDTDTNHLYELDLMETSIVTFPANQSATVAGVKSTLERGELPSLKEFEKFLREAGFSKSQATVIASHGLRKLLGEPVDAVKTVLDILKSV